ncbi:DUF885 domain-containing protein [Gordonia sp. X0973]|uniref:DUF885 domain-containing protein n=1 Tax=Gordonia sp. X0973 TaxID=2742602 RepID=UPI000F51D2F8|nr:DUF885 domain-containing protein [Gordonia sp. X0973]QKT06633.1 DUF885 domain-containing protein [Gordonia sp. X0973]
MPVYLPADDEIVTEYLRIGLAFDLLEEGFVDAYTGDPALRAQVRDEGRPDPAVLARSAAQLHDRLPGDLPADRAEFIGSHLRALECSARKFAGEDIGFVDEVRAYFDVDIAPQDPQVYRESHRQLADALGVADDPETLRAAYRAYRRATEIPADRLGDCVTAFASALRDEVRKSVDLPVAETVEFEIVSDQPWSGFNYYLGGYRSRVAINTDVPQQLSALPHLVAHEAYPGHHTEHCRKEELLVGGGQGEQTIFLVNTPQCLMAEGLADHALRAAIGPDWPLWAETVYADLGLRFDAHRARAVGEATAGLLAVRQDAALLLHDRGSDADEVTTYLARWLLVGEDRARQMLRFLTSGLWRAYISTYVEGYRLLGDWLDAGAADAPDPAAARARRFGRLLDEPLTPARLRAELAN